MNFQRLPNGTYDYILVGDWNKGNLRMKEKLQYPGPDSGTRLDSVCSRPCGLGYYKKLHTGGQEQQCCWVCVPCERNQILINETACAACNLGYWPNVNQSACDEIPVEFVQWSDTQALVSICFSCVGYLTASFAGAVFMKYNNTPVVKSSTRELSYLILVGMFLSHSATFPIVARPSNITCALSRLLPGISFAFIYASLFTKTNRIARILAGSKKKIITKKPRFMTATSQLVITTMLIAIEVCISVSMLVMEPPGPTKLFPAVNRAMLVCNTSVAGVIIPLAFDFLLIGLCTLYALKTRNVPENFNEAKFIGFAMYTTCVIWIAFGPIYFGSDMKVITLCLCVSFSAMVTLVFLFFPKVYIILFHPERNNRSHFTTSKDIRCFIGTRSSSDKKHPSFNNFKKDVQNYGGTNPSNWAIAAANMNNLNWHQDSSSKLSSKNNSERSKSNLGCQEMRSHSCQTSMELLHLLLDIQWRDLTPKVLVRGPRIREESVSGGDEGDSGQLKHITIKLASSTTSVASDWEQHL